jgi:hypothetical protein
VRGLLPGRECSRLTVGILGGFDSRPFRSPAKSGSATRSYDDFVRIVCPRAGLAGLGGFFRGEGASMRMDGSDRVLTDRGKQYLDKYGRA